MSGEKKRKRTTAKPGSFAFDKTKVDELIAELKTNCHMDAKTGCWLSQRHQTKDGAVEIKFGNVQLKGCRWAAIAKRGDWLKEKEEQGKPGPQCPKNCVNPEHVTIRHIKLKTAAATASVARAPVRVRRDYAHTESESALGRLNLSEVRTLHGSASDHLDGEDASTMWNKLCRESRVVNSPIDGAVEFDLSKYCWLDSVGATEDHPGQQLFCGAMVPNHVISWRMCGGTTEALRDRVVLRLCGSTQCIQPFHLALGEKGEDGLLRRLAKRHLESDGVTQEEYAQVAHACKAGLSQWVPDQEKHAKVLRADAHIRPLLDAFHAKRRVIHYFA
jgi:hypothetical protein